MNIAVSLATYKLAPFVRLNLAQLKAIIPDAAVLVSDDRSDQTDEIDAISAEYDSAFVTSNARRGHCGGKIQSVVSGLSFAQQEGADILLVLNQRLVPVLPVFREYVEGPFTDLRTNIMVAGRTTKSQISLPSSKYFNGLGLLTDVLGIRVGSISPADFLKAYTDGYKHGGFFIGLLIEPFLGKLIGSYFKESTHVSYSLGDAKVIAPAFLRREQGTSADYQALASQRGIAGEFDCRDWLEIEPNTLMMRPSLTV